MNVTPLVDVVLVLLIIFMVVIPAMQNGVAIELPSIFNIDDDKKGKTDPIEIAITANGDLFVSRRYLAADAARAELQRMHASEPLRRVLLRADRTLKYAKAREVFAMCQGIGFPGVSFQVNSRKPEGGN